MGAAWLDPSISAKAILKPLPVGQPHGGRLDPLWLARMPSRRGARQRLAQGPRRAETCDRATIAESVNI